MRVYKPISVVHVHAVMLTCYLPSSLVCSTRTKRTPVRPLEAKRQPVFGIASTHRSPVHLVCMYTSSYLGILLIMMLGQVLQFIFPRNPEVFVLRSSASSKQPRTTSASSGWGEGHIRCSAREPYDTSQHLGESSTSTPYTFERARLAASEGTFYVRETFLTITVFLSPSFYTRWQVGCIGFFLGARLLPLSPASEHLL